MSSGTYRVGIELPEGNGNTVALLFLVFCFFNFIFDVFVLTDVENHAVLCGLLVIVEVDRVLKVCHRDCGGIVFNKINIFQFRSLDTQGRIGSLSRSSLAVHFSCGQSNECQKEIS